MAKDLVTKMHIMPHKYHLLLLQWWEAHPASPFKEHVLFLVWMVMGTGSVEQFFSFCKYTDTDQRYSMSDNARGVEDICDVCRFLIPLRDACEKMYGVVMVFTVFTEGRGG